MITLILLIVAVSLMYDRTVNSTEVSGSKYFYLSGGNSLEMYKRMQDSGISGQSLQVFVDMEDRMLELEKLSVCSGISRHIEVTSISQQIKDRFPGFNFSYHVTHIKQATDPTRMVNTRIIC
jgi:hypothetical protein